METTTSANLDTMANTPAPAGSDAKVTYVGRAGNVGAYDFIITPSDRIVIMWKEGRKSRKVVHQATNYGTSLSELMARPGARAGWAKFPGGEECLYFYDKGDDSFGYAYNVTYAEGEWGYAPFVER